MPSLTLRHRALAIAAVTFLTATASAQDLSTRDRQALSAKEADRVARRDLLSILQPAGRNERGNLRRMLSAGFLTKPYATAYRGLCRKDMLTVSYGTTATDDRYEDAPLRPYGLELSALFRVTSRDFRVERRSEKFGPEPFEDACSSTSAADTWFFADNENVAAVGYAVVMAADKALVDGTLKPATCEWTSDCTTAARETLRSPGPDGIVMCLAPKGERCFEVIGRGAIVWIRVDDVGNTPIAPGSIKSLDVEQNIIVT